MTRILVFGDSLSTSGGPGVVMARELEARGHVVNVEAKSGRSAWNFYDREDHALIVKQALWTKPDLVIVWLGTNELGLSSKTNLAAFTRLKNDLGKDGAIVIAIGPPAFADVERRDQSVAVYATMRKVFGVVVDARPRSADLREAPYRTSDGVHFTSRGAAVLGPRLADDVTKLGTVTAGVVIGAAVFVGVALLIALIHSAGGA